MAEKDEILSIYGKVKDGSLELEDLSKTELVNVLKLYKEEISLVKRRLEEEKTEIKNINDEIAKKINNKIKRSLVEKLKIFLF